MSVDESRAIYDACTQFIDVLQTNFATQCSALETANIPLPAPSAQNYFLELNEPSPERMVKNGNVAVFVYQARSSFVDAETTRMGTPQFRYLAQTSYIGVAVVFRMRPVSPGTLFGKTPTMSDIMSARGYLYAGALIETIRLHACCDADDAIDAIRNKDSDYVGVLAFDDDDEPLWGVASAVFEIDQNVKSKLCQ